MNFKCNLLAVCSLLASLHAVAAPTVNWTTSDGHVYDSSNGFESLGALATNTALTNQFAAQGITFTGSARANGCGTVAYAGWVPYGMAGQNYVGSFGPGCSTNNVVETTGIKFASDLSRLAMDAYSSQRGSQSDSLQLFDDGNLVASFLLSDLGYTGLAVNGSNTSTGRYYMNFSSDRSGILVLDGGGMKFDELRFVESASGGVAGNFVFFDNLRFDAANTVPEPASLALVAVGLAACGLRRRKA